MNLRRLLLGVLSVLFQGTLYAATINVPAGGNLQAALDAANPGDTINLQAGATFGAVGGFFLRNKGNSTQVITIQSSALSSLPASGYRVHPSDAPNMPKIIGTSNDEPALRTDPGAHHYQLIGLEIGMSPNHYSGHLVDFGTGVETDVSQLPHDLVVDRCYVHGNPTYDPVNNDFGTKLGISLNSGKTDVLNSYISEIHRVGQDNQAVGGYNGTGPFRIINNYLEAATENILFGGADPHIPNLVTTGIEIRNNYVFKPLSWYPGDTANYAGIHWAVKNLFELKNAQNVIVDGNIMENNWQDGQVGFAVLFTPRNQNGACTWCVVKDVTFTHNIVRHTASAFSVLSSDYLIGPTLPTRNILIQNNLVEDINPTRFGGDGRIFQFSYGSFAGSPGTASNVTFDHNTAFHVGGGNSFGTAGSCCLVDNIFNYTNNIVTHGAFGFKADAGGEGTSALNQYFTNWTMTKNAILSGGSAANYPAGNFFPADATAMKFVNFIDGKGSNGEDLRLSAASPYKGAGTDGKDLGADIDTINAATCGTILGIPTSVCSSYVPPPLPMGPLPAPSLDLPDFLPLNAQISASEPANFQIASYGWSITPMSGVTGSQRASASISAAPSATFTTHSGVADLATQGLVPGPYQISVSATDSNGATSPTTSKTVTLVPADLSAARVYPNPWRADRHGGRKVTFDNLTVNTTIKIFTVSGHWVTTLPQTSTSVQWDLTTDTGDQVASGIYLFLITSDSGVKKTGQIVVIR